jgi:hypothetical protein
MGQMLCILMLKYVVHIVTTVLQKVKLTAGSTEPQIIQAAKTTASAS